MFADRVKETTTTTGTGAYALGGAQSPFRGIDDAFSNDDVVAYHCTNADQSIWESGYGTYNSSGPSLSRTLLDSSTGSLIGWTAGTKYIYVAPLGSLLAPIFSGFSGSSRLGFLQPGALWTHTGDNLLKFWNGTNDIDVALLTAATQGDVPYFGASGVPARLGAGTARLPLLTGGAGQNPAWGYAGLNPGPSSELTIASGAVTATGGHHSIDTQSDAASDDLDTITATALLEGECLILKAENAARVVTVKHGTGNVTLDGGLDFEMDSAASRLVLQKVGSNLVEVSRSPSGGISIESEVSFSGTETDITGIPSSVKRILLQVEGMSTNGTNSTKLELGDAGGFETADYAGQIANATSGSGYSASFGLVVNGQQAAAGSYHGIIELTLKDPANNTWGFASSFGNAASAITPNIGIGHKSLSAPLTQLRFTNGAGQTFDAGTVTPVFFT